MLGSVSPIVLNRLNRNRSPGMLRPTRPAVFIAVLNTWPDAPASRVRSRSKNAAPAPGGDEAGMRGLIAGHCTPDDHGRRHDIEGGTRACLPGHAHPARPAEPHRKTGKVPLGGSGTSQP